jgi:predicted ATP-dependent serine protease
MVKRIAKDKQKLYQCGECGLKYKDKKWADKCEGWCKEHNSCNLEIISHSVKSAD